jgi:hypothetical protein
MNQHHMGDDYLAVALQLPFDLWWGMNSRRMGFIGRGDTWLTFKDVL